MQKLFTIAFMAFSFFLSYVQGTEEEVIRQRTVSYVKAFNQRNAKAMAEHWVPDAEYIHPFTGALAQGREEIEEQFQELMEKGDAQITVAIESVEFPEENKAVERGKATLRTAEGLDQETLFRVTFVKHEGQWNIQKIDEIDWVETPSHYQQLKDLEWLIGDWIDQSEVFEIKSSYRWDKNKNFITNHFLVTALGKIDLEGEQVIGWDPVRKEVRSWMFDSDGGVAEGKWRKEEKAWVVTTTHLLPTGKIGSQLIILTPLDRNSYTLEIANREVEGEMLPNIESVKVIREGGI